MSQTLNIFMPRIVLSSGSGLNGRACVSRTYLEVMGISLELKSTRHCHPESVGNVDGSVPSHSQFSSANGTRMEIESREGDQI